MLNDLSNSFNCAGVKRVRCRFGLAIDNGDDEEISSLLDGDDRWVSSWEDDDDEVLLVIDGEKRLLTSIDDNEWHGRRTHKKKRKKSVSHH